MRPWADVTASGEETERETETQIEAAHDIGFGVLPSSLQAGRRSRIPATLSH